MYQRQKLLLHVKGREEKKIMLITVILFSITFYNIVSGEEWPTVSGEFCIDKCSYKGDGNYFHWCYISDPSKSYTPDPEASRQGSIDPHYKWDYCVPSGKRVRNNIIKTDTHKESEKPPYNPGWTALYPTTLCTTRCLKKNTEHHKTCETITDNPAARIEDYNNDQSPWFYCSTDKNPLILSQLSATNRFWCLDRCRKKTKDGTYECNTLFGRDHCSPQKNTGHRGTNCEFPCEEGSHDDNDDKYYFCYTSLDNSTWEYCGMIMEEETSAFEFTRNGQICADYCREKDENKDYKWCNYVEWKYNASNQQSTLIKNWDYCHGSRVPRTGLSIVIYVAAAIITLIASACLITVCYRKREFQEVSTEEE